MKKNRNHLLLSASNNDQNNTDSSDQRKTSGRSHRTWEVDEFEWWNKTLYITVTVNVSITVQSLSPVILVCDMANVPDILKLHK